MAKNPDQATMVALPGSAHPVPVGSKAVRQTSGQRWLELTIGVRPIKPLPDLSALDQKLPADRKYMTREQLAGQYGSDPEAVKAIEAFATAHNLVVTRNEPASARMGLAGTVENVNTAFGVTLFDYAHPRLGDFHARTGPVHVPAGMDGAITGVFGLNNHRVLRRTFRPARHISPDMATPARSWFTPTELGGVYNFPKVEFEQGVHRPAGVRRRGRYVRRDQLFRENQAERAERASGRDRRRFGRPQRRPRFDRGGDARHRRRGSAGRRCEDRGLLLDVRREGPSRLPQQSDQRLRPTIRPCFQ